jgi:hypothetical protein
MKLAHVVLHAGSILINVKRNYRMYCVLYIRDNTHIHCLPQYK